jgi:Amidohydrolase
MSVIDVHTHYYPPAYLDALRKGPSAVTVTEDAEGNPVLHYPGDYNIAVRGHRDLDHRLEVFAEHGVDVQVLSLTTPGTHVEEPATAVRLASLVNDAFRSAVDRGRGRCTALATLPLNDPEASRRELERACRQLGFKGAMLFSNVNGVPLSDERFWPLYEMAEELDALLYIHPTAPVGVEALSAHPVGPVAPRRRDSVSRGASRSRVPCVRRMPYASEPSAERRPDAPVLLRYGELRSARAAPRDRFRRGRSHPGRQRLSAPDRQHPEDAREPRHARHLGGRAHRHPRRQRHPPVQAADRGRRLTGCRTDVKYE